MIKRLFVCLCMGCLLCLAAVGQTNKKIDALQRKRGALQQEIVQQETLLKSTRKDVKSQLDNLSMLTAQINTRKQLIKQMERDIVAIDNELYALRMELRVLKKDLDEKKRGYEASVKYLHRHRSIEEKLMFIFSAHNLSETYRRMRYVQEYATYQRIQGEELKKKQQQVTAKQQELQQVRTEKANLLAEQNTEREKLQKQEAERRTLVANLQKKQKGLQNEIAQKRAEAQKLNNQIDKLIEEELAAQRRRNNAAKTSGLSSGVNKPVDTYHMNDADRKLSSTFAQNKGILPPPITGPYMVVSHYGAYEVEGLKQVKLDNKGIDIKGQKGAKARAIFDGEVSAIFQYNGMYNVLVRHGSYISVYCNLQGTTVKKGQRVKTKDELGTIAPDAAGNAVLHFQLRKESQKLNPELWLGK